MPEGKKPGCFQDPECFDINHCMDCEWSLECTQGFLSALSAQLKQK